MRHRNLLSTNVACRMLHVGTVESRLKKATCNLKVFINCTYTFQVKLGLLYGFVTPNLTGTKNLKLNEIILQFFFYN